MIRLLRMALVAMVVGWAVSAAATQTDERLDVLFERLKATASADEAEALESMIWDIWHEYPDDGGEITQIMNQGRIFLALDAYDQAEHAFDRVTELAPDFAEGWNKRATTHFLMGDLGASIEEIQRTLALEPRHFGALTGLGLIFMTMDKLDEALKAFEAALAINPHLEAARAHVEALRQALAGDPT